MYVTGEMGKASLGCLGWRWPGRVSKISIGEGLRVHQSKVIEGGRRERDKRNRAEFHSRLASVLVKLGDV